MGIINRYYNIYINFKTLVLIFIVYTWIEINFHQIKKLISRVSINRFMYCFFKMNKLVGVRGTCA